MSVFAAATAMIARGTAVVVVTVNGVVRMVRLTGLRPEQKKRLTAGGYDEVDRTFYRDARNLPLIAPEKMIREERSTRDWSFSKGVRRLRRLDHTPAQVRLIRESA